LWEGTGLACEGKYARIKGIRKRGEPKMSGRFMMWNVLLLKEAEKAAVINLFVEQITRTFRQPSSIHFFKHFGV